MKRNAIVIAIFCIVVNIVTARPPLPDYSNLGEMACKKSDSPFDTLVKNVASAKEAVYNSAWMGTRKDLEAVVKKAEQNIGFESSKHLGRNATMLVPATLDEMRKELKGGNIEGWDSEPLDGYHDPNHNPKNGDSTGKAVWLSVTKSNVLKFTNPEGGEVCYDAVTGKIISNEKMGTKNFEPHYYLHPFNHGDLDVKPHEKVRDDSNRYSKDGDQYKYVGILYERDPNDPDKLYIIDGQTGLPMTPQQVADMPTTLSDMWKDMGLSCVSNDAKDIVPPKEDSQQDVQPDTANQSDADGKSQQLDLKNLNLDDDNYDWCKCAEPGCRASDILVVFGCTKCGKINREYARKALALEQKLKAEGIETHWYGANAEANAHKAAAGN